MGWIIYTAMKAYSAHTVPPKGNVPTAVKAHFLFFFWGGKAVLDSGLYVGPHLTIHLNLTSCPLIPHFSYLFLISSFCPPFSPPAPPDGNIYAVVGKVTVIKLLRYVTSYFFK
jgi:hypothetical protein